MPRVAILGGGIAGLAAAYECEQQRRAGKPLDWHLFESSPRLGGIVSTTRQHTPEGDFLLEDGPDSWVTEKPWAADLARELGLAGDIIPCNEADKRTYILLEGTLVAMPARMRLMVPEDLSTLEDSPLFTKDARQAFHAELARAEWLRRSAPAGDESVASFVERHFGQEVLARIGAPLLSGVFGGDVHQLSVRSVMPAFVQMEQEHGSLIAAVQARARARGTHPPQPTFTSLRQGMGSLAVALIAALPADRLHTGHTAAALERAPHSGWRVRFVGANTASCSIGFVPFDEVLCAVPAAAACALLNGVDASLPSLLPTEASSALLVTLCWPAAMAAFDLLPGFGFLVPQSGKGGGLLAGTFSAQKFPHRAPQGARIIRVFFGGSTAAQPPARSGAELNAWALQALRDILPGLPSPDDGLTTVRRWPHSLPQYAVGHMERMAALQVQLGKLGHLRLLGNSYHGVGVPDLIRDARAAARQIAEGLGPN